MTSKLSQLAAMILEVIKDYHNYQGFHFSSSHILEWVNQFDHDDQVIVLEEFLHILKAGTYFSENKGRLMLLKRIKFLAKLYKFSTVRDFLANVDFLALQKEGKSQDILLKILNEEMLKCYNLGLYQCGKASKKYMIYIDDILATGRTVFNDCLSWLKEESTLGKSNLEKVINGETVLICSLFCIHTGNTVLWRLKMELNNDQILKKIKLFCDFEVQNHTSFSNQQLNFAYPVVAQPQYILDYHNNIPASTKENFAFRSPSKPSKETFFSSPENRIRFENVILAKGVELLNKANNLKPNHRPLGATFPSYKTLGTGTLFFTWSNISNTCPIVFWWKAGGWKPLFPLRGRGL